MHLHDIIAHDFPVNSLRSNVMNVFLLCVSVQPLVSWRTWTWVWNHVTTSTSTPVVAGWRRTSSLRPPPDTAPSTSSGTSWRSSSKVRGPQIHSNTPELNSSAQHQFKQVQKRVRKNWTLKNTCVVMHESQSDTRQEKPIPSVIQLTKNLTWLTARPQFWDVGRQSQSWDFWRSSWRVEVEMFGHELGRDGGDDVSDMNLTFTSCRRLLFNLSLFEAVLLPWLQFVLKGGEMWQWVKTWWLWKPEHES